jgi:hypothetical protein
MSLLRYFHRALCLSIFMILPLIGFSSSALAADRAGAPDATARIVDAIDEANLVELRGHTHPLAAPKYDEGAVEDGFPMPRYSFYFRYVRDRSVSRYRWLGLRYRARQYRRQQPCEQLAIS